MSGLEQAQHCQRRPLARRAGKHVRPLKRQDSTFQQWFRSQNNWRHALANLRRNATHLPALSFWNHLGFKCRVTKKRRQNDLKTRWRCFAESFRLMSRPKCSVKLLERRWLVDTPAAKRLET